MGHFADGLALDSAVSKDQVDGLRAHGLRADNPALSDDAFKAVNDILASIRRQTDHAMKAYWIGLTHGACIGQGIAPTHYLLACVGQKRSLQEAIAFTKEWLGEAMALRANEEEPVPTNDSPEERLSKESGQL